VLTTSLEHTTSGRQQAPQGYTHKPVDRDSWFEITRELSTRAKATYRSSMMNSTDSHSCSIGTSSLRAMILPPGVLTYRNTSQVRGCTASARHYTNNGCRPRGSFSRFSPRPSHTGTRRNPIINSLKVMKHVAGRGFDDARSAYLSGRTHVEVGSTSMAVGGPSVETKVLLTMPES